MLDTMELVNSYVPLYGVKKMDLSKGSEYWYKQYRDYYKKYEKQKKEKAKQDKKNKEVAKRQVTGGGNIPLPLIIGGVAVAGYFLFFNKKKKRK